jgi:hypothetical protein
MCGCASKPTQQDLERAEIQRVLDQAYATQRPILRTCQSLVTDLERKPVDITPQVATVAIVVALVVLVPVIIAAGAKGAPISPRDFRGGSAGSRGSGDSGRYDYALARDRITARCVVAVATEQSVGPDHAAMAVPLVRLSEAYQLASIDPKGPAAQQAQRLFGRALSIVEKQLDREEKDEEYRKRIEGALTSYISLLQKLNRDWQPICSRVRRLHASPECNALVL